MFFSASDLDKIKIIDRAFSALTLDEIKQVFGADVIVDKLKGTTEAEGVLMMATRELQTIKSEIDFAKIESDMLRMDMQMLIRCLNKGMGDPSISSDFNTLKQRHGVY